MLRSQPIIDELIKEWEKAGKKVAESWGYDGIYTLTYIMDRDGCADCMQE